ncbi:hypothetical protein [Candidatus Thiosymbion oneisti]|uniref:hypothetical protein n=1 Tax=Candidatus Thiosymbion oneisti TaxID=589554 RepID=UPI0010618409|nr:hypothetical protein [Candidatus Thiosymbion oneisti]
MQIEPTAPSLRKALQHVLLAVLVVAISACATPRYDAGYEKSVKATASALNVFFVTSKNKTGNIAYKNVVKDYNKVEAMFDDMLLTARLLPNYQGIAGKVEGARNRFLEIRQEHKEEKVLKPGYFQVAQDNFDVQFYDLLMLAGEGVLPK